jgi:hypothetical protein
MALAALVSAAACIGARRAVPWQGRQSSLVMAAAMLLVASGDGAADVGLLLGAVLLLSAMLGTIGVRGTPAAAACCHRALVSLVMAICVFQGASGVAGASRAAAAIGGHSGHGLTGALSVLAVVGVIGVVLWTVLSERFAAADHDRRVARLLSIESWAMAAGVVVMCPGV